MKFLLLATLIASTVAHAGYRIIERTFEIPGVGLFRTVAHNTSLAQAKLGQAVLSGNMAAVESALKEGADLSEKFYLRYTNICPIFRDSDEHPGECHLNGLDLAMYLDHAKMINLYVEKGLVDESQILETALKSSKSAITYSLLKKGVNCKHSLFYAVADNDLELAKAVVANGASALEDSQRLLNIAARHQNATLFIYLVDTAEAQARAKNIKFNKTAFIDFPGADREYWDSKSINNPLNLVVQDDFRSVELAEYLVQNGARLHHKLEDLAFCDNAGIKTNHKIWNWLNEKGLNCGDNRRRRNSRYGDLKQE